LKEANTNVINFDEDDPNALDVLLRFLYGFEVLEPEHYIRDHWCPADVDLNIRVLAISDKYSVMRLVLMAQTYLDNHATAKYLGDKTATRRIVPMLVHAVYNKDAGAVFHEKRESGRMRCRSVQEV
jgi:hypothetical protein